MKIEYAGLEIPLNAGVLERHNPNNGIPRYKIQSSDRAEGMKKDMHSHLKQLKKLHQRNKFLKYCEYGPEEAIDFYKVPFETEDSTLDTKFFYLRNILSKKDEETVANYARDAADNFSDFALEAIASQNPSMLKSVGPIDPRTMRIYGIFLENWENRERKPFDSRRFQLECILIDGGYCSALQSQRDKQKPYEKKIYETKEIDAQTLEDLREIQMIEEDILNFAPSSSEFRKLKAHLENKINKVKSSMELN